MAQRFNMCSPRKRKDGKTHWHPVGSAFVDGDKTTLLFDSLPLPDEEGRVAVMLFEPKQDDRARSASNDRQQARERSNVPLDDDIPF